MPINRPINFEATVSQFADTSATALRSRMDAIAGVIISHLTDTGDPVVPLPPTSFVAIGGVNAVVLTWEAGQYALTYEIERTVFGTTDTTTITTPATSYVDTGLTAGNYTYRIRSRALSGLTSDWVDTDPEVVTVTNEAAAAPTTPTGLAATAVNFERIDLAWDALAAGTVSAQIQRRRGVQPWETIAVVSGTAYQDRPLLEQTRYDYRLIGVASDGVLSDPTAAVFATTPAYDTVPPPVPVVTAEALPLAVRFSWPAVIDTLSPPVTYNIRVGAFDSGPWTTNGPFEGTSFSVSAVEGKEVFAQVASIDARENTSDWSTVVGATALASVPQGPPDAPSNLQVIAFGPGKVFGTFRGVDTSQAQNAGVVFYRLYTSVGPQGSQSGPWTSLSAIPLANNETFELSGLTVGVTHWYYIVSVLATGEESERSNIASLVVQGSATPVGGVNSDIIPYPGGVFGVPGEGGGGGSGGTDPVTDPPPGLATTLPNGVLDLPTAPTMHLYVESTYEENKARFVDAMVNARGGDRTLQSYEYLYTAETFPKIEGKIVQGVQGGKSFIGLRRPGAYSSTPMEVAPYAAGGWPAVTKSVVISDTTFKDTTRPDRPCWSIWISRQYNVPASIIVNSDFGYDDYTFNTGSVPDPTPSDPNRTRCVAGTSGEMWNTWMHEHSVYMDLIGPGHVVGNTFRRMGGRGIYVPYRPYAYQQYPPDNGPITQKNFFLYDNNHCLDLDQSASKGAYNLTFFDHGEPLFPSTIVVRNSTFLGRTPFFRRRNSNVREPVSSEQAINAPQDWVRSNGGVVFYNYEFSQTPQVYPHNVYAGLTPVGGTAGQYDNPGYDPATEAHVCEKFVIQNCLFHYDRMEKPVIKMDGVGELIIENCVFINDTEFGEPRQMLIRINEGRYDANLPNATGTKPITTIRMRNNICRGPVILQFNPPGATEYSQLISTTPHNPGRAWTYNSSGVRTGDTAFDVADSYNPATDLNTLNPWFGIDQQGYTRTYNFPGVTV